jgi:two-component system cell cycle sensor histidine kinase/response regulator CckA
VIETKEKGTGTRRKTLLVVDDQATIRNILVQVLKLEGYDVRSAVHGLDALEVAAGIPQKIDVLLTDLSMPYMGGEELIERLTAERPETRVICLSAAFTEVALAQDVLFLPKPFSLKAVVSMVKGVLDGSLPRGQTMVG